MENPYASGKLGAFYGWQEQKMGILERLGKQYPESCEIIGPRRIGKSTLFHHLYDNKPLYRDYFDDDIEKYLYVLLDLQSEAYATKAGFFDGLYRTTLATLPADFQIGDEKPRSLSENFHAMVKKLADKGFKLICFLDEFDSITARPEFDETFFSELRSLASGQLPLAFVTGTFQPLRELCHSVGVQSSPFFNIFMPFEIGLLRLHEAIELIETPSRNAGIPYDERDTNFILTLAGHHPYLLRCACYHLFERKTTVKQLSAEDYRSVKEQFMQETRAYMEYCWEELRDEEKEILSQLVQSPRIKIQAEASLRSLLKKGLVQEKYTGCEIFSEGFRDFVLQMTAPPPDKIRKLRDLILKYYPAAFLETWLDSQPETSRFRGTLEHKLEEYLILSDETKREALKALGVPTVLGILREFGVEPPAFMTLDGLSERVLHTLGFMTVQKPRGISDSIQQVRKRLADVTASDSTPEVIGMAIEACLELEGVLQNVCQFYTLFIFEDKWGDYFTQLGFRHRDEDRPLNFNELTIGQLKHLLSDLERLGKSDFREKYTTAFGRKCHFLSAEEVELTRQINEQRSRHLAHKYEVPWGALPLKGAKREVEQFLEGILKIFQLLADREIYPKIVSYFGVEIDHHGEKLVRCIDDNGKKLMMRTSKALEPGACYYCFSQTNPIALNPVLVKKE